jgi:hypothetical protein
LYRKQSDSREKKKNNEREKWIESFLLWRRKEENKLNSNNHDQQNTEKICPDVGGINIK